MTSAKGAATEVSYIADDGEPVTVDFDRVDAERVVRGRPVLTPVSRAGQRNYSGLYWSSTTQAHLVYESLLERDRLLLADFCPSVAWMAAQPFWMRGYDGSTFRRHVPDLLLQHRNGSFTVVDVKPERMLNKPKVIEVLKWTDRVHRERGWQYEVWSSTNATELSNVRFLSLAKRSRFVDPVASERVSAVATDGMTIDQILRASQDGSAVTRSAAVTALLEQLWLSRWATDLRIPLSGTSAITVGSAAA
ncbi:TnsA-like heteromeric transposase endonuclease subunit [Mycobacterium marinum]|uniref:TnsA-like heteromeric transposase endonuclease subunit n=1 Tax=Mycobacterium marinum TaxID=1781 RepID=UPI0035676F54